MSGSGEEDVIGCQARIARDERGLSEVWPPEVKFLTLEM